MVAMFAHMVSIQLMAGYHRQVNRKWLITLVYNVSIQKQQYLYNYILISLYVEPILKTIKLLVLLMDKYH